MITRVFSVASTYLNGDNEQYVLPRGNYNITVINGHARIRSRIEWTRV